MLKIIAGTSLVLLAGATATGSVILHRTSGSARTTYDSELPDTFADMKSKVHEEGCVRGLFPGLSSVPTNSDSANNIDEDFFRDSPETTGCLVVNKDGYADPANNWRGILRFLWAVKGESKGFIVLLVGTASSDSANIEIKWEATSYSLAKSGEEIPTWTAKKHQEVQTGSTSSQKKSHVIPENICTESECPDDQDQSTFRGYWEWESGTAGGTQKLSEWTRELGAWGQEIFEDDSLKVKALADKQTGTWTNRVADANPYS